MLKVISGIVLFRIKCDRIEGAGPASTSTFTYVSTTEEFDNGQIFHGLSCNICECCMVLYSFYQVPAAMLRPGMRTSLMPVFQNSRTCHVATGWPNACIMLRPTMLKDVAFECG